MGKNVYIIVQTYWDDSVIQGIYTNKQKCLKDFKKLKNSNSDGKTIIKVKECPSNCVSSENWKVICE